MYEIEYVNGEGETIRKTVPTHSLARETAKGIAKSLGKRVIVRRKTDHSRWNMLVVDLETKTIYEVGKGFSSHSAMKFWRSWDFRGIHAIALPWPEEISPPRDLSFDAGV